MVGLAAGALGTGIVKLPGANSATGTGTGGGKIEEPTFASGPVESPPPIDNLATPAQGTLTLGDESAVQAIQLGVDGASTTVSAPGQPWDGLKIDIPAGSWPGSTLQITAQPITGSSFGDLVTPISPLYTVSGAEGMAPTPVTLKIPATVPDDSFAMGFFYDGSGRLEGMPLLAEDGTSVTIATQHFSAGFLSLVKKALLRTEIDSGFRPGKDDWQFTNRGPYIAPNGQCAGQSLTEAWYYIERRLKAGAAPLYGLYDNNGADKTPYLWQDDSDGYRLAGVAQVQYQANTGPGTVDKFFRSWRGLGFDALQYDAFRYAIAVTGEPQLMSISDANDQKGHAILAYRVAPSAIFVADPNYPAGLKFVPFDGKSGKFGTFLSGVSATEIAKGNATSYVNFAYKAKTALVDWSALTADWAAFDAGTIGDGVFPAYKLEALTKNAQGQDVWVPLVDGYRTAERKLTLRLVDPQNADDVKMTVYRGTSSTPAGTSIMPAAGSSTIAAPQQRQVTIDLNAGENPLGILEEGSKPAWDAWKYVDFVRLTVTLGPAASPSAVTGGRWVLAATEPGGGPDASSYEKPGEKLTVESSNGRIAVSYNYDGPPHRNEVSSVSWGPPPASAAPGDTWTTTLSAQGTCSFDIDEQGWGASVSVIAIWTEAGQKGTRDWSAGADCSKGTGSTPLSWAFPVHDEFSGNNFEILVSGGDSNGGDDWTYRYEWRP